MKANAPLAPYVRSYFEDYLACQRNVAARTVETYRDGIKLFLVYSASCMRKSAADLRLDEIDDALVLGFLDHLEVVRRNSIGTRNHRLAILRSFIRYLASREPLQLEACRRILAIPSKKTATVPEITYLEKEEVEAILSSVDRHRPFGRRDYALLLFLYNTGARVQEVANARPSTLSLEEPYRVEILGKGGKWRTCPLWESTVAAIRDVLRASPPGPAGEAPVFRNRLGQQFTRSGIEGIVSKYSRRAAAALPGLARKNVTPHVFRHTTAMHLLQAGVELNVIRAWLGHVSIATTNGYVEIDLAMKAKALETCEPTTGRRPARRWKSDPEILAWLESL